MHICQALGFVVRKFAFCALIGFLVILLLGPAVALVSVLFSFAVVALTALLPLVLVGLLVSIPVRCLRRQKLVSWPGVCTKTRAVCQTAVAGPMRTGVRVCHGALQTGHRARAKCQGMMHLLGGILAEMISGALVGVLLGGLMALQTEHLTESVLASAGIGAGLGILVGASRLRWIRRSFMDQPPEEPAT
jgi:hypothetical protein